MQNKDYNKFLAAMTGAGEMYNKQMPDSLLTLYWNALKHLSIEVFEQAINKHVMDPDKGTFMPKPADIIRQVSGTSQKQSEAVEDKALLAWSEIELKMKRVGSYGKLKLEDKQALAAVQSVGGWRHLCGLTNEKLVWIKREFISVYETYERTPVEQLPCDLAGRIAIDKQRGGESEGLKTLAQAAGKFIKADK